MVGLNEEWRGQVGVIGRDCGGYGSVGGMELGGDGGNCSVLWCVEW